MPRARAATPPKWAEGVTEVPLRKATPAELGEISRQRGLGFSSLELRKIQLYYRRETREPTDVELAGLAQSWSEHCSYKSSRPILRKAFGRLHAAPRVLGTGDAGVMAFTEREAYALRIESHNHPSAVEPYGGAATGIGGILRDVLAVGGKPVALADPLFFGPPGTDPERIPAGIRGPQYLMDGVVAGIRDYGNRVGVPTVTGGIYFDPAYVVNPLVNVACLGFLPRSRLLPNAAQGAGERLVLAGGLTGRDGIGGVAFASQELTERSEEESRGAVQLGNPIMKEPLIHACLEAADAGLIRGLKDLGGGGLATASGELVHAGGFGSRIELEKVPLREEGLLPWEIWISESQERMLLSVHPRHLKRVLAIFAKHDVPATDVGEVVPGASETLSFRGEPAASLRLAFRLEPPRPSRPATRRRPSTGGARVEEDATALFNDLVLAPDSVSREPVIRVYDHEVQGLTVLNPLQGRVESPSHGDAAVLRPLPSSWKALAVTVAAQPWSCREDPRHGAMLVVEEAARNLYSVGGRPDSFTNCLNFGNPEDPHVLGDFEAVTEGLAETARDLGFAVPSGNVSFYNGGLGSAIPPTPVLFAVGIVEDLRRATTSDLKESGDPIYLVGRSSPEMGGSLWARRAGRAGLGVPAPDGPALRRRGERLIRAMSEGLVRACHDVSDGGLAVALAEMAFGGGLGFEVDLAGTGLADAPTALAAEGASRWVIEVANDRAEAFERAFEGEPCVRLGRVTTRGGGLRWHDSAVASIDLGALYSEWRGGLARGASKSP